MQAETWARVREAFAAIMDAPSVRRRELLFSLDEEVRGEVESLLEANDQAGGFLEPDRGAGPGSTVGPYRLLEEIGSGGMGVVFRAERRDGEFHREVAIKLIGGRQFAPEAERRFVFERQVLARLDHPNIVRMLDGGIDEGRRYLVMELVDGEGLVEHCLKTNLSTAGRLRLFRHVCDAVRHVHQNLVIHGDLKPNNILVTAQGEVKVLDFGIARLAEPSDPERIATKTLLRPMTLAYASPEQARGERLTASTDIYSLGVVLYELLAGENPQSRADLPLDAALRRVCEEEPPRLPRHFPGDLDAIVRKALAKDPQARYGSASELMGDIERFLEGSPVLAQRPTLLYTARKFVRRNRLVSTVAAALLVSVLAGLFAFAWEARVADRERALAQSRFSQARRLIGTVIFDIEPKLEKISGATALRVTLLDSTLRYLEEMGKNSGNDPVFLRELVHSYIELARVQGDLSGSSVGDHSAAQKTMDGAANLLDRLLAVDPRGQQSLYTAVQAYRQFSQLRLQKGLRDEALAYAKKAVEAAERLAQVQPTGDNRVTHANALFSLASSTRSLDTYRRALDIYQALLKNKPGDSSLLRNAALVHKNMGSILHDQRNSESIAESRKALELDREVLRGNPSDPRTQLDVAIDLSQLSQGYFLAGDLKQATSFAAESVQLRQKVLDANPDDIRALDRLAWATSLLAFYKTDGGNLAGAQPELRRAAALYDRLRARTTLVDQSIGKLAHVKLLLGQGEKQAGKAGPGCALIHESVALYGQFKGVPGDSEFRFRERALREDAVCRGR